MMKDPFVCNACGKKFGGITGFDDHRVGAFKDDHPDYGRSCRSAFRLVLMGYALKNGVWKQPMGEGQINRYRDMRRECP